MLMRQIKKDGSLPANKRNKLGAILFIPAIIIFVFVFKQISNWRADILYKKDQIELNNFVSSNHEKLLLAQQRIKRERYKMQDILQKVGYMRQEHPNHEQLISNVIISWNKGLQELWTTYIDTGKEIKYYWLLTNTKEGKNVKEKFSKRAVDLENNNKKALKKYDKVISSIRGNLIKSLDRARRLLDSNRRDAKTKSQRRKNQITRQNILSFDDNPEEKLVNFIGTIDSRLKEEVVNLQKLIHTSGQQSIIIRNYLQNNPDLELPLSRTINNWIILENDSKKKLNQILYAVEAEYIALSLDLPWKSPAIRAMHKSLLRNVPLIVGKAAKEKKNIDQSYNIAPEK